MSEEGTSNDWSDLVDALELDDRPTEGPDGSERTWYQWYASFGTRGFVRSVAAPDSGAADLRVQFDVPSAGTRADVADRVRAELESVVDVALEVVSTDEEIVLASTEPVEIDRGVWGALLDRLSELAGVADDESLEGVAWLRDSSTGGEDAGSSKPAPSNPATSTNDDTAADETGRGAVFEAIGDGSDDGASAALRDIRLASVEVRDAEDRGLDVRLVLDGVLPSDERERLGRELAHSLRARYDVAARPIPRDDSTDDTADGSRLGIRVEPADVDIAEDSEEDLEARVEAYFDRLKRFDDLGVSLADVIGIGESEGGRSDRNSRTSRPDERRSETDRSAPGDDEPGSRREGAERSEDSARADMGDGAESGDRRKRDADRPRSKSRDSGPTGGSRERSDKSDKGRRRESSDADDATGVVLGIDDENSTATEPSNGPLEAGNYTDPRLMREDATTPLVDVVLRHPGYAERRMGHNLSILLDVDYSDAIDLVESAPCVIAWGVGHERGEKFQRVIEDAGGKVVLVEPDSLP